MGVKREIVIVVEAVIGQVRGEDAKSSGQQGAPGNRCLCQEPALTFISPALYLLVGGGGGGCWSLSQLQTGEGRDECELIAGPCLSVWGFCYLAQGYLGSALKVSWQLYCHKHKTKRKDQSLGLRLETI
ncbi:hypothetical protein D4764_05G0012420 [Takifugu flavidus]|uniref:Uncharacterized protein n=1 Tax=Takifugu flavidus TaxID=433684 RepID=A0A5C6N0Z6_9TELE|nr:hypothetical protein D4764_05G0012420 [Takifugu flavidus]